MPVASDIPDPTAVYIDIAFKVENGHDYSVAEAKIDFQRLFHALGDMIHTNTSLEATLASTKQLLEEREIEIFQKDLEIFSLSDPTTRLKKEPADD